MPSDGPHVFGVVPIATATSKVLRNVRVVPHLKVDVDALAGSLIHEHAIGKAIVWRLLLNGGLEFGER